MRSWASSRTPITGTIYEGIVKRVMDFGAFIEILPGKEGLCHISRLSKTRIEKVTDVVHEGDKIKVKLLEVDRLGRLNLAAVDALDENGNIPMPERHGSSGDEPRREDTRREDTRREESRSDSIATALRPGPRPSEGRFPEEIG